jgi:hypothetical protein
MDKVSIQISELQKHLKDVLEKINSHKSKHNIDYGNIDKFLEHANNGANAKDHQEAARELFAAIGEINKVVKSVDTTVLNDTLKKDDKDDEEQRKGS